MRVSELLEAQTASTPIQRPRHGDVVRIVMNHALKLFKAPPEILKDAAQQMRVSDRFWDESIDEVTSSLDQLVKMANDPNEENDNQDEVEDYYRMALENVLSNMFHFYQDPMNHPPGYKTPKLKFTDLKLKPSDIEKELSQLPSFAEALKVHKDRSKAYWAAQAAKAKKKS